MSRRSTFFAPLVLALFVMGGLQAVWSTGLAVAYKTISNTLATYPGQIRVDPSGRLVVERVVKGEVRHQTTDGRPVDVPEFPYWISGASLGASLSARERDTRLVWRQRLREVTAPTRPTVTWYLVHSETAEGAGYFIGYNDLSKMVVGYVARDGFRTVLPPEDQWFSLVGAAQRNGYWYQNTFQKASGSATFESLGPPNGIVYLVAGGRVWRVDLISRMAKVIYESEDAVSVWGSPVVMELPADKIPEGWRGGPYYVLSGGGLLVRTPTEVIGVDFQGEPRRSWPIPLKLRGADLTWYELSDGGALAAELRTDGDIYWAQCFWIDAAGNIAREEEVFTEPRPPASRLYWMYAAVVPQACLASLVEVVGMPIFAVNNGLQPDYPTAAAQAIRDGWPALLAVYLLSAALACLAYRRQTRYALPGPAAWAAFVFLFGVPGWLAHRWHRRWPALEACGACGRAAPRDRGACAACGHLFAPPPLIGTEIFA